MDRLGYDADYGSLVRRKAKDTIDGYPFLLGLATLLRQLHPTASQQFFTYLGQFIRGSIHETLTAESMLRSKRKDIAPEVVGVIIFLRQLAATMRIPDEALHAFVPAYILDAVSVEP